MTDPTDGTPEEPATREGERIAKLLSRAGVASRREAERMIADGRVKLGEELITSPATVLTDLRNVTVDGKPVREPEPARLFAFHKPAGLLTAERDPQGRATIYNALRNALPAGTPRVMPVGRLDLNTEGLLLLTNDGELKRAMELPASGIPRTYRARTYGEVTQAQLEELMEGTTIDGIHYGRIDANMERRTGRNQWIELTLTEGKNREVRRVLEALGLEVSRLLRTRYGPFELLDLPRGQAIEIRPADVERFRASLKTLPRQSPGNPGRSGAPGRSAGGPRRKPDPSRPLDRDAPRSPPRRSAAPGKERGSEDRSPRGPRGPGKGGPGKGGPGRSGPGAGGSGAGGSGAGGSASRYNRRGPRS